MARQPLHPITTKIRKGSEKGEREWLLYEKPGIRASCQGGLCMTHIYEFHLYRKASRRLPGIVACVCAGRVGLPCKRPAAPDLPMCLLACSFTSKSTTTPVAAFRILRSLEHLTNACCDWARWSSDLLPRLLAFLRRLFATMTEFGVWFHSHHQFIVELGLFIVRGDSS